MDATEGLVLEEEQRQDQGRYKEWKAWMEEVDSCIRDEIDGLTLVGLGEGIPWLDWWDQGKDPIRACQDALHQKGY